MCETLTNFIVKAAKKSIPMTTTTPVKKAVPWWSENLNYFKTVKNKLSRKLKQLNDRFQNIKKDITQRNEDRLTEIVIEIGQIRILYNKVCAIFKQKIRESKKESWELYIKTITERTPMSKIWKKFSMGF